MEEFEIKQKYIFFASLDIRSGDYMHFMYHDLLGYDNITFIDTPFNANKNDGLYKFLHKYHFHGVLNKYFELPFKSLWNRFYFNDKFDNPQKLCFVFFMTELVKSNESFFKYLKKQYPGCKLVLYFDDIIASRDRNGKNPLRLDFIDKYFDLALSYDKGDCQQYGYLFYPTPYSKVLINNNPSILVSDLFFCGAAKQRYSTIIDIYKNCRSNVVVCDFIVSRYGGEAILDGIEYVSYMKPYGEYLEHMIKSNCLLDVIQEGSHGFTVRVWEALVYGKKLLTNNKEILNAPFYDERQFCYFEKITEKEIEFIKKKETINPRYIEELSPLRMLEYIDNKL